MDVRINTIVSRFSIPFQQINDDDAITPASTATAVSATSSAAPRRDALNTSFRDAFTEEGMDGAHAYVLSSAAFTAPLSSVDHYKGSSQKNPAHDGPLVDLTKLVSCMWNAELQRTAALTAPTACVLRPPPYVLDNTVYRGASAYVLPSGVVRLVTYGCVEATRRIAHRVRQSICDACLPSAVRRAAREERLLLDAVFAAEDASESSPVRPKKEGAESTSGDASLSLAVALATCATGALGTSHAAAHRQREGADEKAKEKAEDHPHSFDFLKIDFIQSAAAPCWGEIAGLRESFFTERAPTQEAREEVSWPDTQTPETSSGTAATGARCVPSFAAPITPARVRRASVNVRGDAPLAWWQWYLAASEQPDKDDAPVQALIDAQEHNASSSSISDGDRGNKVDDDAETSAAMGHSDPTSRFWTCAGHADVPPSSVRAAAFVRYLRDQRARVAHHVVSFRVRRNASQSSIQLLLEWNTAAPPASARATVSSAVPSVPLLPSHGLSWGGPSLKTDSTVSAPEKAAFLSATRADTSLPPATLAPSNARSAGVAWVTEASAANFFLESTFIAESTMSYELESARPGTVGAEEALPVLSTQEKEALGSAEDIHHFGRDGAGQTLPSEAQKKALPTSAASRMAPSVQSPAGGTLASPRLGDMLKGKRRTTTATATATPAVVMTEQVSCLVHRTGRAQLSTGSELAIRQVCEVMLIPFLVATADLTLCEREA